MSFIRAARSGSLTNDAALIPGAVNVWGFGGVYASYSVIISGARADGTLTCSQASASNKTASLPFDSNWGAGTASFASLHVLGTPSGPVVEELTGSFASGNIFPGDAFLWSSRSYHYYHVSGTLMTMTLSCSFGFTTASAVSTTTPPPSTGQLFPRGFYT